MLGNERFFERQFERKTDLIGCHKLHDAQQEIVARARRTVKFKLSLAGQKMMDCLET